MMPSFWGKHTYCLTLVIVTKQGRQFAMHGSNVIVKRDHPLTSYLVHKNNTHKVLSSIFFETSDYMRLPKVLLNRT